MSRLVLAVYLLLCGCSTRPTYFDPRTLPIALPLGTYAHTADPERYTCELRAPLVCKRIGRTRGEVDCTCF